MNNTCVGNIQPQDRHFKRAPLPTPTHPPQKKCLTHKTVTLSQHLLSSFSFRVSVTTTTTWSTMTLTTTSAILILIQTLILIHTHIHTLSCMHTNTHKKKKSDWLAVRSGSMLESDACNLDHDEQWLIQHDPKQINNYHGKKEREKKKRLKWLIISPHPKFRHARKPHWFAAQMLQNDGRVHYKNLLSSLNLPLIGLTFLC